MPPSPRGSSALAPVGPIPGRAPAWQRRFRRHRHVVAALLVGVVIWSVTTTLRPPAPTPVTVLVARHDLAPGAVLTADDVALESRAAGTVPTDVVTSPDPAAGRTIAFPVLAGEPISARHVIAPAFLTALGPGTVATAVRLADTSSSTLVTAGDVVDVIAATSSGAGTGSATATVVAARVRVIVAAAATGSSGGLLGSSAPTRDGSTLVLATTTAQALALAGAAVDSRLSVTVRGTP